jgi:fluoride ion exporter CrcB/FEX
MNSIFPTIPLGTLSTNLIGGFIIGIVMAVNRNIAYLPEDLLLEPLPDMEGTK